MSATPVNNSMIVNFGARGQITFTGPQDEITGVVSPLLALAEKAEALETKYREARAQFRDASLRTDNRSEGGTVADIIFYSSHSAQKLKDFKAAENECTSAREAMENFDARLHELVTKMETIANRAGIGFTVVNSSGSVFQVALIEKIVEVDGDGYRFHIKVGGKPAETFENRRDIAGRYVGIALAKEEKEKALRHIQECSDAIGALQELLRRTPSAPKLSAVETLFTKSAELDKHKAREEARNELDRRLAIATNKLPFAKESLRAAEKRLADLEKLFNERYEGAICSIIKKEKIQ